MPEYFDLINQYIQLYGWYFILPFLFLENIPIIGLIAPGVTVLFLAGFFSSLIGNVYLLFVACTGTIILADSIWYALGKTSQGKWRLVRHIAERSPNVEKLLTEQPLLYLMFYQFIPYFRMFLPFALGMYRLPTAVWLTLVVIGTVAFVTVFFGVGVLTARAVSTVVETIAVTQALNGALVTMMIIYTVYLVIRYIRIKKA